MANTASAKKRVRQNEKRRLRNKAEKSRLRTYLKKFLTAVEGGKKDEAKAAFTEAVSLLDRASKHHVIHDNQASRRKSRMQQKLNALLAG